MKLWKALFVLGTTSTTKAFTSRRIFSKSAFTATTGSFVKPERCLTLNSSTTKSPIVATLPKDWDDALQNVISTLSSTAPTKMVELLSNFANQYFVSCVQNPNNTPESTSKNFLTTCQLSMKYGIPPNQFRFKKVHKALRGGEEDNEMNIDFQKMGDEFAEASINHKTSVLVGKENLENAFNQIKAGENVVFLGNHQSEGDPQVFSILLNTIGYGVEASNVHFVAGHKVTTDPYAIPFSMGRNLICIHSKKHINVDPELKPLKTKQNLEAMSGMLELLRNGGASLWVAPSGGRDRRDLETGYVPVTPFDQKTIDLFRLLGNKSKVKTHFYPLVMYSYDLFPPPDTAEAGVGETRQVNYTPVGLSCGEELESIGSVEKRHLFTDNALERCQKLYSELMESMEIEEKSVEPPL